jgi:hypothetical protein
MLILIRTYQSSQNPFRQLVCTMMYTMYVLSAVVWIDMLGYASFVVVSIEF